MAKKPPKLPIQAIDPNAPVLSTVPLAHERLLGRFIVEWAKLENTMDDLIWHFLNLPIELGRVITARLEASNKIQMIRQLSECCFGFSSDYQLHHFICEILSQTDILREERNLAMHGTWGRHHIDWTPMAFSLRIKDKPSTVVSEHFPEWRMRRMIAESLRLKVILMRLFEPALAAHHRSRAQFPPG